VLHACSTAFPNEREIHQRIARVYHKMVRNIGSQSVVLAAPVCTHLVSLFQTTSVPDTLQVFELLVRAVAVDHPETHAMFSTVMGVCCRTVVASMQAGSAAHAQHRAAAAQQHHSPVMAGQAVPTGSIEFSLFPDYLRGLFGLASAMVDCCPRAVMRIGVDGSDGSNQIGSPGGAASVNATNSLLPLLLQLSVASISPGPAQCIENLALKTALELWQSVLSMVIMPTEPYAMQVRQHVDECCGHLGGSMVNVIIWGLADSFRSCRHYDRLADILQKLMLQAPDATNRWLISALGSPQFPISDDRFRAQDKEMFMRALWNLARQNGPKKRFRSVVDLFAKICQGSDSAESLGMYVSTAPSPSNRDDPIMLG